MKNFLTFLLSLLSTTALLSQASGETRLQVLSGSETETLLHFSLTGVDHFPVTTPQGPAAVIQFADGLPLLQKGMPDVPKFAASLMIPATGNMEVEIVASEYQEYTGVKVAPSKGDLKRNVDPATVPYTYGSAYAQDAFFPGQLAGLREPFILRAVRGQALWIYPVQYNPVTEVLRVYASITLRVHHTGGAGANELRPNPALQSRAFEQLYAKMFVNFREEYLDRSAAGEPEKMLVIAKNSFIPTLEPFLEWKRQSGIHTTVVPLSEIGASTASAVHDFVLAYHAANPITYLLLVGDENDISPLMRPSGGTDYSCDNCFGYLDGTDHLSDIFVGRFNAATEQQLAIMVSRNIEYEKNPLIDTEADWCGTGMASASNQGAGFGDDGQADYQQGNEWKEKHLDNTFEKYWEFYDGDQSAISPTPGDETADQPGDPVNTQLVDVMNGQGVSLYNYTGHGWEQGLVSGNFNTDAVANLRNHGRYPFIIAVACCAGNFTNNGAGDCLGEAFQRAGDPATGEAWGGIGGMFSSDYQSWSPPMEGQDGMNQYLLDADGLTLRPSLGGMAAFGNALMIAGYDGGGEVMADFWNPFLDPSTMPRTRLPQELTATHPGAVFVGATSLEVQSDVEGALVSLYWQGQTLAVGTVENGSVTLEFPALDGVEPLVVTVTQFNYAPYQSAVPVTVASGPFVINQSMLLDDAAGNHNNKADFGETVSVDLQLANIGVSPALATAATFSTTDDNVIVIDGVESFGDLDVDSSLEKTGAFAFTVNNDVVDGHIVIFTLHLTYNDTLSFDIQVPVKLQAPALSVETLIIDDVQGGNGNGRLESGETAVVVVNTVNTGASQSPLATGLLSSSSPWLTVSGPAALGQLAPLSGNANGFFTVTVDADAPPVVPAMFHYQASAGSYLAEKDFGPYTVNAIIEAFDTYNFNSFDWQMGGNKPWTIATANAYSGLACARSGNITHLQQSVMELELNVSTDGEISFARKVSSEANYDFLRFQIDHVDVASWSGTLPWEVVTFPVTPGLHTFTWVYEKDQLGSDGQDRAWVDEISLPPFQIVVPTQTPAGPGSRLLVSPNPTAGRFLLSSTTGQPRRLSVFDGLGRMVRSVEAEERSGQAWSQWVDLGGLSSGVYFVQVQYAGEMRVVKVVKE
jgi:hypothetical protein